MSCRTVEQLISPLLPEGELENYDYYIYNNSFFTPVQVDLDDEVFINECLLHICTKGVSPQTDRFERPRSVYTIAYLFSE